MASKSERDARDIKIGILLLNGKTNTEVAKEMGLSVARIGQLRDKAIAAAQSVTDLEMPPSSPASPPGKSPDDIELEKLAAEAAHGRHVAPQIAIVMARKCQVRLMRAMDAGSCPTCGHGGELGPREVAQALQNVESVRKSAESAINIRKEVREEVAGELLEILDRVVPNAMYEKFVAELEKG